MAVGFLFLTWYTPPACLYLRIQISQVILEVLLKHILLRASQLATAPLLRSSVTASLSLVLYRSGEVPPCDTSSVQEAFQVPMGLKPFSLRCLLSRVFRLYFHHSPCSCAVQESPFSASSPRDWILPLDFVSCFCLHFLYPHRPQL